MDYSSLVKKTNFNRVKKKKVMSKIDNYNNALNGYKTNVYKSKVTAPLGKRYFYNTGIKCGKNNRYIFANHKPSGIKSIYDSALFSINQIKDKFNTSTTYKCKKKKFTTIGVNGKKKAKRHYVEPFVNLQEMNVGQQFFIGLIAVLGLYLFYKAISKK
jgi:hypothetical protein